MRGGTLSRQEDLRQPCCCQAIRRGRGVLTHPGHSGKNFTNLCEFQEKRLANPPVWKWLDGGERPAFCSFICPSGLSATAVAAVGVTGVPRAGRSHGEERHNCHCEDQKTLNHFHRGLHASAKIVRRRPLRRQGGAPALPNAGARSSRTAGGCATVPSVTVMRGR